MLPTGEFSECSAGGALVTQFAANRMFALATNWAAAFLNGPGWPGPAIEYGSYHLSQCDGVCSGKETKMHRDAPDSELHLKH